MTILPFYLRSSKWDALLMRNFANLDARGTLEGRLTVGEWGEIGGSNASPAIQGMIDDLGFYRLPAGTFNCQDPILIYPHTQNDLMSLGTVFSGEGPEASILNAVGMTGESLIKYAADEGFYRLTMRDFGVTGDADKAIDFNMSTGYLFRSRFENLRLASVAGSCFHSSLSYTLVLESVYAASDEGHSFDLQGGNTTLLMNCYAGKVGDGCAGYRIRGHASLIECNGLDDTDGATYWGWFGESPYIYQILILGGNAEDFGTAAIALEYDGQIYIDNIPFLARASGTFETYIKILSGNAHRISLGGNMRNLTKGATRSGNSNIQGTGCLPMAYNPSSSTTGPFPDFYNTTVSQLYNVPGLQVRTGTFGRLDLQITSLHSLRESGYIKPDVTTITANATTFSVAGLNAVKTANTVATSLAQLTGGEDAQTIRLLINDANTTIKHNTGGTGKFILKSAADEIPASGAVYTFTWFSNVWQQN